MSFAAEAWEPVLFGGLIPILGAAGIAFLLWYAVRQKPEQEQEIGKRKEEERKEEEASGEKP